MFSDNCRVEVLHSPRHPPFELGGCRVGWKFKSIGARKKVSPSLYLLPVELSVSEIVEIFMVGYQRQ